MGEQAPQNLITTRRLTPPMPIGEVGDHVPDFADFDRSMRARPSPDVASLVGTALGGAVIALLT
jgi:hypothetical protein